MDKDLYWKDTLSALNDPNRRAILRILMEHPQGLSVKAITEHLSLSRPAVSYHLKNLRNSRLITLNQKGLENFYYLTMTECFSNMKKLIKEFEQKYALDND